VGAVAPELGACDGWGRAADEREQVHAFRVAGGEPEPGIGNVRLVPTYDGVPIAGEMPTTVQLSRPGSSDGRKIEARLANGTIELTGIETGIYDVSFSLGRNEADRLWTEPSPRAPLALLHDAETVRHEIAMQVPMDVVAPPEVATRPDRPRRFVLRSPVRIVWNPVRGATRYRVVLMSPGTDTEDPEERVTETTEPTWTAELPPSPRDWQYMVIVEAHGARAKLGSIAVGFAVADGVDQAEGH
jgi:hypothetical protein